MDIPSSSDYLEIKKRKQMNIYNPEKNASSYTSNKQYVTIQTTASADEDGCIETPERYNVILPYYDLAVLYYPNRFVPKKMFGIRDIDKKPLSFYRKRDPRYKKEKCA